MTRGYVEGRERGDRIPLGRESIRSAAGAGGRTGPPTGRRDHYERRHCASVGGQGGNDHDPHRLHLGEDPVRLGLVSSLARPGGNLTGINFLHWGIGDEAAGTPARAGTQSSSPGRTRQSDRCRQCRSHLERSWKSAARAYGTANPSSQRQHQPGDRCSFRHLFARAARRPIRRHATAVHQPRVQLALLAARHAIPAIYRVREYVEVGGLMSYGVNLSDA